MAGCDLIKRVFISDEFEGKFSSYNIKHLTIPLYSAWFGSTWERLIKTVKGCLYKLVGRERLPYFELLTVLSDIQNAVNSRPLTYRCSGDYELDVISPNAFLCPHYNNSVFLNIKDNPFDVEVPNRMNLLDSLEKRDLLERFHKLWHEDYLLSLREQSRELYEGF